MNILRVEYAITGEVAFLSHLEVTKAFERAIRRAEIPIAFSEGFNPHPKIAIGAPLSVGMAGKHEYLDLELREAISPVNFKEKINTKLPVGMEVLMARIIPKAKPLMAIINSASYRVELDADHVDIAVLKQAVKGFLALETFLFERKTQKGIKTIDVRKGVHELKTAFSVLNFDLEMLLAMGNDGNVRPDEVALAVFAQVEGLSKDAIMKSYRTGLFIFKDGKRISPMNFGSEDIV